MITKEKFEQLYWKLYNKKKNEGDFIDILWPHISDAIDETRSEADAEGLRRGIESMKLEFDEAIQKAKDKGFDAGIDEVKKNIEKWQADRDIFIEDYCRDDFLSRLEGLKKGAK